MLNVTVKRGSDIASDHHLVIGEIKIKLSSQRQPPTSRWRYGVDKLKNKDNRQSFELALGNQYAALMEKEEREYHGREEAKERGASTGKIWETVLKQDIHRDV